MKCLSCNREFNTDREYCPFCGEKIGEVESTSSAVVEPVNNTATSVPNNPVPNEPASSMITNNNYKRKEIYGMGYSFFSFR